MSDTTHDIICHQKRIAHTLKDVGEMWRDSNQQFDILFASRENNYSNIPKTNLLLTILAALKIYSFITNHFKWLKERQQDDSNLTNSEQELKTLLQKPNKLNILNLQILRLINQLNGYNLTGYLDKVIVYEHSFTECILINLIKAKQAQLFPVNYMFLEINNKWQLGMIANDNQKRFRNNGCNSNYI